MSESQQYCHRVKLPLANPIGKRYGFFASGDTHSSGRMAELISDGLSSASIQFNSIQLLLYY